MRKKKRAPSKRRKLTKLKSITERLARLDVRLARHDAMARTLRERRAKLIAAAEEILGGREA